MLLCTWAMQSSLERDWMALYGCQRAQVWVADGAPQWAHWAKEWDMACITVVNWVVNCNNTIIIEPQFRSVEAPQKALQQFTVFSYFKASPPRNCVWIVYSEHHCCSPGFSFSLWKLQTVSPCVFLFSGLYCGNSYFHFLYYSQCGCHYFYTVSGCCGTTGCICMHCMMALVRSTSLYPVSWVPHFTLSWRYQIEVHYYYYYYYYYCILTLSTFCRALDISGTSLHRLEPGVPYFHYLTTAHKTR